jgi:predicted nuclease of predicted toxin-antitoxin system
MKFLADMGVSMTVIRTLRSDGYEAVHLSEMGLQRLPDADIMQKAIHWTLYNFEVIPSQIYSLAISG